MHFQRVAICGSLHRSLLGEGGGRHRHGWEAPLAALQQSCRPPAWTASGWAAWLLPQLQWEKAPARVKAESVCQGCRVDSVQKITTPCSSLGRVGRWSLGILRCVLDFRYNQGCGLEREILPANVPPVIDRDRSSFEKLSKLLFPNVPLPGAKADQRMASCLRWCRFGQVSAQNQSLERAYGGHAAKSLLRRHHWPEVLQLPCKAI